MPLFDYRARDSSGKLITGTSESATSQSVASSLEEQGFIPITIEEKKKSGDTFQSKFSMALPFKKYRKPRERDLIVFTRQLSAMLGAGVPIISTLRELEKQSQNIPLAEAVAQIRNEINMGTSFSDALKKHPRIFSEVYIEMVVAGEVSGNLREILDRLGTMLEYEEATKAKIAMATRYPILVVCTIGLALLFLLNFVLPKFSNLFTSMNVKLPLPTRILIFVGKFTQNFWYLILLSIAALFVGYRFYKKTPQGRLRIDKTTLKIPIFGPLNAKIIISRFAQMLAVLTRSGIPINYAISVVSQTLDNRVFENALEEVQKNLVAGQGFNEPLKKSGLFPPMVTQMLAIGEETGELETMLDRVVEYYEMEIDYVIKNLVTMLEPILVAILAVAVLIVALGIFLPMWNLLEAYSKNM